MLKQLLAAIRGTTAPPAGRKITVGCGAVHHFIRQVHRNGIDRGAVASFGNTYDVEQTLTDQAGEVAGALMSIERRVLQGKREGTALYDSLVSLGESFARRVLHPRLPLDWSWLSPMARTSARLASRPNQLRPVKPIDDCLKPVAIQCSAF
ncbi:MAG UNVERIFIED_CONTAM: hypothetical protein LVR18_02610 [Planctomycetaceae bacterium]